MCHQLVLARVGQAEAMAASRDAKQQLQAAQSDYQRALEELARTNKLLATTDQEVQHQRLQLATCTRELSDSGMQRFELSQTLQEAQTQLAAQLELSGKLRARAKKYRASQDSLSKQLNAAMAASAASSQQSVEAAGAVEQELLHTKERLELTMTELAQANEAQAVLQQQNEQAEAEKQKVGDATNLHNQTLPICHMSAHTNTLSDMMSTVHICKTQLKQFDNVLCSVQIEPKYMTTTVRGVFCLLSCSCCRSHSSENSI